ncbi:MAG: helix-turn-helix domain-containing protein, partial [Candidatus Zixiibacteriota bacterium]
MARPIKIVLRSLTRRERRLLKEKLRDKSLAVRIHERYRVVAEAMAGRSPVEIADRVGVHFTTVYDWMHRFNQEGFR